ncbi:C40 family peptidase [Alcaligenes sp. Marseille-Q7550]
MNLAAFTQRLIALLLLALLSACAGAPPGPASRSSVTVEDGRRSAVVLSAMTLLDSPFRYGGREPSTGFDCSGLVHYVFSQERSSSPIPRSSAEQAGASRRISRKQLRPGDLVFFNTLGRPNSHVGIYIGNNQFINAPSSGGRVRIDSMDNPYFARRFETARTFFE